MHVSYLSQFNLPSKPISTRILNGTSTLQGFAPWQISISVTLEVELLKKAAKITFPIIHLSPPQLDSWTFCKSLKKKSFLWWRSCLENSSSEDENFQEVMSNWKGGGHNCYFYHFFSVVLHLWIFNLNTCTACTVFACNYRELHNFWFWTSIKQIIFLIKIC